MTVMVSFNSWNGEKCHGHRFLVTELLKERLGFEGLVVSDWDGINYLHEDYATADPRRDDVAVVVIGETSYAEGFGDIRLGDGVLVEAGSMVNGLMNPIEPYARSLVLAQIHPEDLACIRRIAARGILVVAVLISGRPLIVDEELAASAALVAGWLPGSEGHGLAEVLFGRFDFTGRLPLPWRDRSGEPRFPPEESEAVYAEVNLATEFGYMPVGLRLGARYERTDIASQALSPAYSAINWIAGNELTALQGAPEFTELEGDYDIFLPNLDFRIDFAGALVGRVSWRDDFLAGTGQANVGAGPPTYVASYRQVDLSVSYWFRDNMQVYADALNVTDETTHVYGRHESQTLFAAQAGPRYNVGFRYKF